MRLPISIVRARPGLQLARGSQAQGASATGAERHSAASVNTQSARRVNVRTSGGRAGSSPASMLSLDAAFARDRELTYTEGNAKRPCNPG